MYAIQTFLISYLYRSTLKDNSKYDYEKKLTLTICKGSKDQQKTLQKVIYIEKSDTNYLLFFHNFEFEY